MRYSLSALSLFAFALALFLLPGSFAGSTAVEAGNVRLCPVHKVRVCRKFLGVKVKCWHEERVKCL